jgi:hypothetical protein
MYRSGYRGIRAFTLLYIAAIFLNPLAPAFAGGERIVVMQVQGKGLASDEKNIYRSALVESLGESYEVLSGDDVDKKVQEIFQKESAESAECDAEKCLQEIAIALQAELIATCTVVKRPGGYLLNFQISNVLENRVIFAKSEPCKDCDEFRIVDVLKAMASGKKTIAKAEAPKDQAVAQEDEGGLPWLWIALGVAALGGAAAVAGADTPADSTSPTETGSTTVTW